MGYSTSKMIPEASYVPLEGDDGKGSPIVTSERRFEFERNFGGSQHDVHCLAEPAKSLSMDGKCGEE